MPAVATANLQSLVLSAHAKLPHSAAIWLAVTDALQAKAAFKRLVDRIAFGIPDPQRRSALHLLFSAAGLSLLGVPDEHVQGLGRPWAQGIASPHRSRALGDGGQNDPSGWLWNDTTAHAVLLLYGMDEQAVLAEQEQLTAHLQGCKVLAALATRVSPDGREHFGFRDGLIATHVDLGDGKTYTPEADVLPTGEVLLGHRNALDILENVPPVGRDGSLVVVRQLGQDVQGFWEFWRQHGDEQTAVWLAAKAVGRWPNGMPVSGSEPIPEPVYDASVAERPLSFRDDRDGDACPLGAHIRRANPRDGMGHDPERSLQLTALHRMLRRGRLYGQVAPGAWFPAGIYRKSPTTRTATQERGLLFVALCTDLARQFEFVQQTWLNNPKHGGRSDEVDPIAAGDGIVGDEERFHIPRIPVRQRLHDVKRWVTVHGGGYFLLPSRTALQQLFGP